VDELKCLSEEELWELVVADPGAVEEALARLTVRPT
jgi:hypothetical protein